jgi:hypothetical protein
MPSGGPYDLYPLLAAQFAEVFERPGAAADGGSLLYLTGDQVISRLNRTLGLEGWSFRVLEHGIHAEAGEVWVLGELRVLSGDAGGPIVRQQFGSQQVKRSRRSGRPLDIGFDLKGATTDCLKKCATLIGVGLYLTRKEEPAPAAVQDQTDESPPAPDAPPPPGLRCADCGKALNKRVRLRDGTIWTPTMLAEHGRSKHGRVLCPADLRAAEQPNGVVASEDGGR